MIAMNARPQHIAARMNVGLVNLDTYLATFLVRLLVRLGHVVHHEPLRDRRRAQEERGIADAGPASVVITASADDTVPWWALVETRPVILLVSARVENAGVARLATDPHIILLPHPFRVQQLTDALDMSRNG